MNAVMSSLLLFSVLFPQKGWFTPNEPINIHVKPAGEVSLLLADFGGRSIDSKGSVVVTSEKTVDIKSLFPDIVTPGTYLLYAVPKDKPNKDFVGTPLVISVRSDTRTGAQPGVMVVKVSPLCYATMTTDKGPMMMAFYYDVAPHTVENFLSLAEARFYDGLNFNRIVKDFIIQGGDPRGDGTGGPGYTVEAEFNERPHVAGVVSMSRQTDPNEAGGAMPRSDFANSAGSQFFICLDYKKTQQLDRRYTAFAKVMNGMDTIKAIAAVPIADEHDGTPKEPPKIVKVEIRPVTATENPYPLMIEQIHPSTIAPGTISP